MEALLSRQCERFGSTRGSMTLQRHKVSISQRVCAHIQMLRVIRRSTRASVGTHVRCSERDDADAKPRQSSLETIIRRKQRELQFKLEELGTEAVEERLQSATVTPAVPSYRFATLCAEILPTGRPVLLAEVSRKSPTESVTGLVSRAQHLLDSGADVLVVHTDAVHTSEGLKDLFTVCNAVKSPVLARDWYIHPLQLTEAKEAGAAGVLGVIRGVSGRGTAIMSSFAAALGMDAPVEVVNMQEVEELSPLGVSLFAVNVSVGITLAIPEFTNRLTEGLLGSLPFGSLSIVGAKTEQEVINARRNGADALLLKLELLDSCNDAADLIQRLRYRLSGDD